MYLNNESLDTIRARFNSPENAVFKEKMEILAGSSISHPPITPEEFVNNSGTRNIEQFILAHAFMYLMTEDTIYRDRAIDYLMTTLEYDGWTEGSQSDLTRSHISRGVAIAYDWLYNDLTETQQAAIRQRLLYESGNYSEDLPEGIGVDGELRIWTVPEARTWLIDRPWQNHGWHSLSGMIITGYAVREEAPEGQDMIDFGLEKFDEWLGIQALDGSWSEGITYAYYGYEPFALTYYLANELDNYPYPQINMYDNSTKFLAHMTVPGSSRSNPYGDMSASNPNVNAPAVLSIIASKYDQPLAEYYYHMMMDDIGAWTIMPQYLLMHTDLPSEDPSTLPKTGYYPDLGMITSRNSWTDPTSSWFAFKSGWYGGMNANLIHGGDYLMNNGHDHRDNNNVVFWKNNEFILNDPLNFYCPHPHIEGVIVKCHDAWTHNLPVFDDIEMVYERSLENDEGLALFNEYYNSDDMLRYEDHGEYLFATGDSHRLYEPEAGLSKYRRSIVYVGDYLIMLDLVELNQVRRIDWNFHTETTPYEHQDGMRFYSENNDFTLSFLNSQEYTQTITVDEKRVNMSKSSQITSMLAVLHPTNEPVELIQEGKNYRVNLITTSESFLFDNYGELIQKCPELDFNGDCFVSQADFYYLFFHYDSLFDLTRLGRILGS